MSFLRRSFSRKLPTDGLLEISQRIYVFNSSMSTSNKSVKECKSYLGGIVTSLQTCHPGASFMVFNFREGDQTSLLSDILIDYDMTVVDYPCHYQGYPLLPLEMIHCFLRSSDNWLSLEGQKNVILMHYEKGGWPVLAFMLAGLLLYRKQYSGEQKTLELVYKQARKEINSDMSVINYLASQIRYLQYIMRKDLASEWPSSDVPVIVDYILLRNLPLFDGGKGCRPVVRVYGQDPSAKADRSAHLLFSSVTADEPAWLYSKEDCVFVKLELRCQIEGDVILECVHLLDDQVSEEIIFRVMFHTGFIHSNISVFNSDEMDVPWNTNLSKDFKAEVLFRDTNEVLVNITLESGGEEESLDTDSEFFEVEEILTPTSDNGENKVSNDTISQKVILPEINEHKDYTLRNGAPRWDLEVEIGNTSIGSIEQISLGEEICKEASEVESDLSTLSKNNIVVESCETEIQHVKEIDRTSIKQISLEDINHKQASEAESDISTSSKNNLVVDSYGSNILEMEQSRNTFIKQTSNEDANDKHLAEVKSNSAIIKSSKCSDEVNPYGSNMRGVKGIRYSFIKHISSEEENYKQDFEVECDVSTASKNIIVVDSSESDIKDVKVEIEPKTTVVPPLTKPQLNKKNKWQEIASKTIKQQRVVSQWIPRAKTPQSSEAMKPKIPVYKWVPKGPISPAKDASEE